MRPLHAGFNPQMPLSKDVLALYSRVSAVGLPPSYFMIAQFCHKKEEGRHQNVGSGLLERLLWGHGTNKKINHLPAFFNGGRRSSGRALRHNLGT